MYSSFGRQIFESADSGRAANVISELIDKLRERRVAETEFDAGFEQVVFTNKHSSQKALVQYVLRRVAIFEGQPFIGETDDLTIEHLLPQSSAKDDSDEFLIGQLGNLILVDQKTNEMLSTNDFSEKREILMSRGYKIPKVLEDTNKLTREVISENTKRISILAREEIWWI